MMERRILTCWPDGSQTLEIVEEPEVPEADPAGEPAE